MIQKFEWEWNVPKEINIGQLCSSIHLGTEFENKLAMIVENDELGTDQISFKELAKKTDQFAQCLINLGLQREDRVLIRLPNSLDYPISFLGAMKAGYISVPTSTLLTAEEVVYLANDSQATALVTDKSMWKSLQEHTLPPQLKYIFLTGAGGIEKSDKFDIFDMAAKIGAAVLHGLDVFRPEISLGHTAIHLHRAHGGDQHNRARRKPCLTAFNLEEFLSPQISAEPCSGHNVIGQLQRRGRGDDRVAAMRNIGKRAAMHKGGIVFEGLDKVGLHRILEQNRHRPIGLDIAAIDGAAISAISHDHIAKALLKILQIL